MKYVKDLLGIYTIGAIVVVKKSYTNNPFDCTESASQYVIRKSNKLLR
jgi:hypothetical protein